MRIRFMPSLKFVRQRFQRGYKVMSPQYNNMVFKLQTSQIVLNVNWKQ
jgi:hypothetical protein